MNKKAKCSARICRLLCFMVVFPLWVNAVAKPQENIRITLKLENATLAQAIDDIRQQSSYLFANKDVDLDKRVSISVTEETIHKVCELLFTPIRDLHLQPSGASSGKNLRHDPRPVGLPRPRGGSDRVRHDQRHYYRP